MKLPFVVVKRLYWRENEELRERLHIAKKANEDLEQMLSITEDLNEAQYNSIIELEEENKALGKSLSEHVDMLLEAEKKIDALSQ